MDLSVFLLLIIFSSSVHVSIKKCQMLIVLFYIYTVYSLGQRLDSSQ
jgi:hypothetical protein